MLACVAPRGWMVATARGKAARGFAFTLLGVNNVKDFFGGKVLKKMPYLISWKPLLFKNMLYVGCLKHFVKG